MMSKKYSLMSLLVGVSMFLCYSCNTCNRPEKLENITIEIDLSDLHSDSIYLKIGQKVLYVLPTPIEASMLIKNWGVPSKSVLNDPANASSYLTKKKMALNFGVYITDMTTAGLYEQTQTVLNYKQAITKLIEGLGLKSAISPQTMQRIEDNMNDKNELLNIISELYSTCTEFLSDDDRDFYALAMLTGGWVEGMFIATHMIDETQGANLEKMKQLINDNKLAFDLLWTALGNLDVIPDEALYLMLDMSYVAHLFGHQTLLGIPQNADNINNITLKYFADLKSHIHQLRHQFVKK